MFSGVYYIIKFGRGKKWHLIAVCINYSAILINIICD